MSESELPNHPAYTAPCISLRPYRFGFHPDALTTSGYVMELKVLAKALMTPAQERKKFLIVGRARSGTTLLKSLLDQVDGLTCEGEMLHNGVVAPRRLLNGLARKAKTPAYGCKLLSYQLVEVQRIRTPMRFFSQLHEDGFKLIHIERNTVDQVLSLLTARKSRAFTPEELDRLGRPDGRLHLDTELFRNALTANMAFLDLERRIMAQMPHLHVSYDYDLDDRGTHQATVDRICDFVGVPSSRVETRLSKRREGHRRDRFSNYDELARIARAAGLELPPETG